MSDHHQFVVHLTHSLFFLYKVDFRQTISLLSIVYRTRAKISSAYSKLTRFLDAPIFEKNQEMLIFDHCLFKKNVKDVKKICKKEGQIGHDAFDAVS